MSKITLQLPDRVEPQIVDYQIEGQAFRLTIENENYEGTLVVTAPGEGWLNCQGKILPFYMTQKQETLYIWLNGGTYQVQLATAASRRGLGGHAVLDNEIKAPMPGTILKMLVKPGDTVEANQPLVIMESMKMEMTLSAPATATVKQVSATEGQLVEMGAILVHLE